MCKTRKDIYNLFRQMILKNDRKQGKGHKEIVLKSKFKMLTNP